ncbi:Mag2 protein [Martiniozyma asiatica (nom. inval.)]|nr:Mag2 protein [Martiniozyma asiatica]
MSRRRSRHPVADDSVDILHILKSNKRGTNISHLLDYQLPRYSSDYVPDSTTPVTSNAKYRKKKVSNHLHLEGMAYINANYKFILSHSIDVIDPSIPPDEKDIVRVIVNNGDYHCPICLGDDFVAPRMTRCGHIFCYTCILSLFDATKNDPKQLKKNPNLATNCVVPCPLCSSFIKEKHRLLPVLVDPRPIKEGSQNLQGKKVTLTLMCHPYNSINAIPVFRYLTADKINQGVIPVPSLATPRDYYHYDEIKYNRLLSCTSKFTKDALLFDQENLRTQKYVDVQEYGADPKWFDLALELIDTQIAQLANDENEDKDTSIDFSEFSIGDDSYKRQWTSEDEMFYYYECLPINSRQLYVLSNLDMRVIRQLYLGNGMAKVTQSESVDANIQLPFELDVQVENVIDTQINEETLNKAKFLSHYPLGKELCILEIDWKKNGNYPPGLTPDLLKKVQTRSKNFKSKNKAEEKARIIGEKKREKETFKPWMQEEEQQHQELSSLGTSKKQEKAKANLAHLNYEGLQRPEKSDGKFKSTVWGTHIPVIVDPEEEARKRLQEEEAAKEFNELVNQAKQEQGQNGSNGNGGKKGKKKKIVIPL